MLRSSGAEAISESATGQTAARPWDGVACVFNSAAAMSSVFGVETSMYQEAYRHKDCNIASSGGRAKDI